MQLEVTDLDIESAEQILFGRINVFDAERRIFLKNLDTCDLQAVPGSGKTTVLLAKLLILEKRLPLDSGRGILVLSHTNTAVNEIKKKIGKHCPKLFSYPSFVGTIQSFVDKFLAIPCYANLYKKRPLRIDNEIYMETIEREFNFKIKDFSVQEHKNAKWFINAKGLLGGYRIQFNNPNFELVKYINGKNVEIEKPKKNSKAWVDFSEAEKSRIKQWLISLKKKVFNKGILHYDDAYFFANVYLSRNPQILSFLKRRFNYLFIDEMQDMEKHQFELLETIFYDPSNTTVFQRIGDINQSIFTDGSSTSSSSWTDREAKLTLSGSHRLNPGVAKVVQNFGAESFIEINGLHTSNEVKPHIILFDQQSKGRVIEAFANLIKQHQANNEIPLVLDHPIKVIGWNGKLPEPDKLRIKDYFEPYDKEEQKPKIDYPNLLSYLKYFDKGTLTLDPIRKNILNAILRVIRLEDIKEDGRNFTKRRFLNYLALVSPSKAEEFSKSLYQWCINIIKGKVTEVHQGIIENVTVLICEIFSKEALGLQSMFFLNDTSTLETIDGPLIAKNNVFCYEDLKFEVTNIHSVKGETHTATLYLETCYHKHETEFCLDAILGNYTPFKKRQKQAAKMMYVGFSRPTHLLCFAASLDRLQNKVEELERVGWKVIHLNESTGNPTIAIEAEVLGATNEIE
ncbi:UvrD-helicase domain-containing protein [Adhaeribacter soli]|nr:UvrD-helicase domain-containing protein [Adhaeribacter soli]